jgi:predicted dehydrogenase/threonine dehydrogenase-like Zn-dependent dehydrogenase
MKQLLQNMANGETKVADVPSPRPGAGQLLIHTSATLVSAGTERMLIEFGKANWLDKTRQQPDKVRMVLEKVRTDGLAATLEAVQSKLDQPLAWGYCNVGVVAEIGAGVEGFAIGDRMVSNGKHAEVVCVPKNLCARVPEKVTDQQAVFTVLAAIGLQGVRLVNPTLGECVAVTGLGVIGLLTVQLLRAQGCRVLGIDLDPARLAMARNFGAEVVDLSRGEDPLALAAAFSRGRGVDAVLITASTKSNQPIRQAAKMCRQRGRIVLVGVTGLELSRADFYEKELSFQVSCSYGPGRYDPAYEEGGQDYPVGFVRWTEQRNFEAVLDLLASERLDVRPLISHRFPLERAAEAYALLTSNVPSLGILLEYPGTTAQPAGTLAARTVLLPRAVDVHPATPSVCFLGAGNYASRVLMPAFKAAGTLLHTVVSGGGVSAVHHGSKQGFVQASTDAAAAIADPAVDTVVVATRHDSHARYVLHALRAGKHVFCEKPLCLTLEELREIEVEARSRPAQTLMVGFNRRFAPQVVRIKQLLSGVADPKSFVMTVNACAIPHDHWTQDPAVGGGRIIGEACHFVDLLQFLAGAPIVSVQAVALGLRHTSFMGDDKATFTLSFADGSVGTVHYLANGHRSFAKERLEVFCAGRILQLDNFRRLRGFGWPGFKKMNLWQQDKGNLACAAAFVDAIRQGKPAPIPFQELIVTTLATLAVVEALKNGRPVITDWESVMRPVELTAGCEAKGGPVKVEAANQRDQVGEGAK